MDTFLIGITKFAFSAKFQMHAHTSTSACDKPRALHEVDAYSFPATFRAVGAYVAVNTHSCTSTWLTVRYLDIMDTELITSVMAATAIFSVSFQDRCHESGCSTRVQVLMFRKFFLISKSSSAAACTFVSNALIFE